MSRIKKYSEYVSINELFIHNNNNDLDGKYFLLYKKDVWIFSEDEYEDKWEEISNKLPFELEGSLFNDLDNINSEYPYVLIGKFENGDIVLGNEARHSSSSNELQKLSKELDMLVKIMYRHGVDDNDDSTFYLDDLNRDELKDKYFYHGTCLAFFNSIKKHGIKPTQTNNFKIQHLDKIFTTLNLEKAFFHAKTAAVKNSSYPIIIKHRIPDTSKLVLDYDISIGVLGKNSPETKKLGYDKVLKKSVYGKYQGKIDNTFGNKTELMKRLGIFGYTGRIPSTYIDKVLIDSSTLEVNWHYFDEGYDIPERLEHDSEIWNELDYVEKWSELTLDETTKRIDRIESEYNSETYGDDEDDEDDNY